MISYGSTPTRLPGEGDGNTILLPDKWLRGRRAGNRSFFNMRTATNPPSTILFHNVQVLVQSTTPKVEPEMIPPCWLHGILYGPGGSPVNPRHPCCPSTAVSTHASGVPPAALHPASNASQLVKHIPKVVLPTVVAGTDPASISSRHTKSSLMVNLLLNMIFILSEVCVFR